MNTKKPRRWYRRTAEEKQRLIAQWKSSGLTAQAFCQQHKITPSNFYSWRKRYDTDDSHHGDNEPIPAFIDLSSLNGARTRNWHIILKLDDAIELSLSQR